MHIRPDGLLEAAKAIFGDELVSDAYVYAAGNLTVKEAKRFTAGMTVSETAIDPPIGESITIEFTNGKTFRIWISEWGGIETITRENEEL